MTYAIKKLVGPLVENFLVDIRGPTDMSLYRKVVKTYDLIMGMDWLETHRLLLSVT
jgi:hypothetical protein